MSRLKLVLLVLIVAALGIIFFQNREPLTLKLLCPDSTQSCLYQTPPLPLAVWMGVFAAGGLITSLLGQLLNRYRYSGVSKTKSGYDDLKSDSSNKWSQKQEEREDFPVGEQYNSSTYEIPQEPESVERSGSNYSYKYRDSSNKSKSNNVADSKANSSESLRNSNIDLNKEDEDWI